MKVDNAIILAAGYSSRFVPLCFDLPKGLLKIRDETLIERQIKQLHDVGVDDICVVTGNRAEQFEFLKKKYGIRLIFNKDYATKNNFASFYAAREFLGNSLITSSDLYFTRNIFTHEFEHPYYVSVFAEGQTCQRCLTLDDNDRIIATGYQGHDCWITFGGHAVLDKTVSSGLIKYIDAVYDDPSCANKYWIDFQDEHVDELQMYIKRIKRQDIVEFNTLEALRSFYPEFHAADYSDTMSFLCRTLGAAERELGQFEPLKLGNDAIGCSFYLNDTRYQYLRKENIVEKLQ